MRNNHVADASSPDRLSAVKQLLDQNKPDQAGKLLAGSRSPAETNALGVCLLRLGKHQEAIQLFRGLVLPGGGVVTSRDVPVAYRLNFASALLADGNYDGFISFLNDVPPADHSEAKRLHEIHDRWLQSISMGRKLLWRLGVSQPPSWPALPTEAGTLEHA